MTTDAERLQGIARAAVDLVPNDSIVGLGTGRAANEFIHALSERCREGLKVRGVATSEQSAALAQQLGIPLVELDAVDSIDIDVDGADEVDPECNVIKGYGGALLREKIVAALSKQVVILAGPEKLVPRLGTRGKLPIEVVPFSVPYCIRRLKALGVPAELRKTLAGDPYLTDNRNYVVDARVGPLQDAPAFERDVVAITGVIETGLFLGVATTVLIQQGPAVEVRRPPAT